MDKKHVFLLIFDPKHFIYAIGVSIGVFFLKRLNIIGFGVTESTSEEGALASSESNNSFFEWLLSFF